ncbi:serine/threonine-protein kinase [Jidongwangia harbinensis]|uniref:serine/threonine-protein kinase n=1 Tax=Jidongwangia harbinensis TaxID=2878561 RepID=UPI001CDA1639|nr:serine/threonine-protein kinase [Jidongwangia harbinensis]MCA2214233.1 protein kinase [Jidongwangia harbinensis]
MPTAPTLLVGRYRLGESLGRGGMGQVWLARDETLDRDVAVKEIILPPELMAGERDAVQRRTLREARAAARLSHGNVVQVYDVLQADGRTWIVMEYVPSRSLQEVVAADGPLEPRRAAQMGLQILAALRAAHRAGVRHRDVKPANVLLADDGRVVLTDFGIATIEGDSVVTRADLVLGSPEFMSPERARNGVATPGSDLWSLGATLYTAVEGRSPFHRESTLGTLTALAADEPDPPEHAGVLAPVLDGLLRKDPEQRIDAAETERLLRVAAGAEVPAERRGRRGVPRPRRSAAAAGAAAATGADESPAAPAEAADGPRASAAEAPEAADGTTAASPAEAPAPAEAPEPTETPAPAEVSEPAEAQKSAEPAESDAPTAASAEARPTGTPTAASPEARPTDVPTAVSAEAQPTEASSAASPEARPSDTPTAGPPEAPPAAAVAVAPAPTAPAARPASAPARRRRLLVVVAAALLALVVGTVSWWALRSEESGRTTADPPAAPATTTAAPPSTPATTAPTSAAPSPTAPGGSDGGGAAPATSTPPRNGNATARTRPPLPSGWREHKDPTGFSVYVHRSWRHSIDEDGRVYFRGNGRTLGIDQTDEPESDPVADWKGKAEYRVSIGDFPGYDEIRIDPVRYFRKAADWEFTFNEGSRQHVNNRGVVVSDKQAYGIWWQTQDSEWDEARSDLQLVFDSFRPDED